MSARLWTAIGICILALSRVSAEEMTSTEFKLSNDEQQILDLANQQRKAYGLPELSANPKLCEAARSHSTTMATWRRIGHNIDGKDPGYRIAMTGFAHAGYSENVAAGQSSPADAIMSWLRSSGHRANLLGRHMQTGIGIVTAADGTKYYTQVFATGQ
jgi:serralysin